MKRSAVSLLLVTCAVGLSIGVAAASDQASAKSAEPAAKAAKAPMVRYMVIAPHTAEQCVATLDDMEAAKVLNKFEFGCMDGDHTGYAIVTASSAEEALKIVPADVRDKARAVKLSKFTPAELKAIHEKMKS